MTPPESRSRSSLFAVAAGLILAISLVSTRTARPDDGPHAPRPYPPGPLGDVVRLGEAIVKDTPNHPLSKAYSGNALACGACHLEGGRKPKAGSFLGTASAYPAYSPREKRVITLEDRILNCFMRSCNGVRPPLGSEVSVAVAAYITWLSQGQPIAMNPEKPLGPDHVPPLKVDPAKADAARGKALYVEHCADCHGANGAGRKKNPPVWGPQSFNAGAGLASLDGLTSWLKVAMPLDDPSLDVDEARDLAAYLIAQPRPRFVLKEHLPTAERMGQYNSRVLDEVREPASNH
ncbi:c-type cytochrome [Aquisphaera insulae]|uniref:c-type cytochrome n=1 Tax=Aquisphaera insulae TaxID=2712864 RepID=UPI0013EB3AA0|nr:c-type cytochrome [Aquisphaera insulae]